MKCIAISVDEVMTWIDDFCESTALSPSKAGLVYAELAFTGDFESLIAQVMVRSFSMAEDSDEEYEKGVREILRDGFENLPESEQSAFKEHFIRVLTHHGFKATAITSLFQNLNPLSLYKGKVMKMNKAFVFDHDFIVDNFFESHIQNGA